MYKLAPIADNQMKRLFLYDGTLYYYYWHVSKSMAMLSFGGDSWPANRLYALAVLLTISYPYAIQIFLLDIMNYIFPT